MERSLRLRIPSCRERLLGAPKVPTLGFCAYKGGAWTEDLKRNSKRQRRKSEPREPVASGTSPSLHRGRQILQLQRNPVSVKGLAGPWLTCCLANLPHPGGLGGRSVAN